VRFVDGQALGGCSGTLVAPTVFVTAGHCAVRKQQDPGLDVYVTFESTWTKAAPPQQRYQVAYAVASPPLDLGVEILAEPVTGIAPASLATPGTAEDLVVGPGSADLVLVGYGQGGVPWDRSGTQTWTESPRLTAVVRLVQVSTDGVRTLNPASPSGPPTGCAGNSGAGLFLPGTDTVTAIAVAGDAACRTQGTGVRLDSAAARSFLGQWVAVP
jgi:hypothetical protein